MNIVLLQAAEGSEIEGPNVRVPFGNYRIEKLGSFENCNMIINGSDPLEVNSKLILSNNSTIKMFATEAKNLTVKFVRET